MSDEVALSALDWEEKVGIAAKPTHLGCAYETRALGLDYEKESFNADVAIATLRRG